MKKIMMTTLLAILPFANIASSMEAGDLHNKNGTNNMPIQHHTNLNHMNNGNTVTQPYTGYQHQIVRSITVDKANNLLLGKGAGYSLVAELNNYPGSKHVLELGKELGLTKEQELKIKELFDKMDRDARQIGRNIVDLEMELDFTLRKGRITSEELTRLVNEIAVLEGKYRFTHVVNHMMTTQVLKKDQITKYNVVRGYVFTTATHQVNMSTNETKTHNPYAGYHTRTIKALSPEHVENLLLGKGAGYALAAELNHYPGPKHVLEFAKELQLTPEQTRKTSELIQPMQARAVMIGKEIVEVEKQLDSAFKNNTITIPHLEKLLHSATVAEGQYRLTHLQPHLAMKEILNQDQIKKYDVLRGYDSK